jgi:hypothetical protein
MKTNDRTLCPICFTIFPPRTLPADYPTCPHCESEAISVDTVPLETFLDETPLEKLEKLQRDWDAATGFYEAYKKEKAAKIAAVIRLKRGRK